MDERAAKSMTSAALNPNRTDRVGLTLGPLLFNWSAEAIAEFYARIADEAPFDRVHVGEVVCSKREPLYRDALAGAIERLERAGKTVVLSTLALVTTRRESAALAATAAAYDGLIEANDTSALGALAGRPHVIGPLTNCYNEATLAFLAGNGAATVCLPPELPLPAIRILAATARELGVGIEVFAFGRIPLAISARCYHARVHGLSKDSCRYVCGQDMDGLAVETLDGQDFLAVNGLQTLSHAWCSYAGHLPALRDAGIGSVRLSPHSCDMVAVAGVFRDVLDGRVEASAADECLARLVPGAAFANGYLYSQPGIAFRRADHALAAD
jgi:O2-independent ubiquinone biosynthesis protein UbiV